VTITLTGDCEFDAVTVSSGDTLNLNGKRAEFSGLLTGPGTIACGTNALIETSGHISFDNSGTWTGNANVIHQGAISGSPYSHYKPSSAAADGITNLMWNNDANPQRWADGFIKNLIIADGDSSFGDPPPTTGPIENITIATGASLNGADRTITCAGDFTTSGGLIGQSCLSFDSSNTEYAEVADHADLDFPFNRNKLTLECWFKTSTNDAHQYLFDRRNGQDVFYMYIDHGDDTLRGRIFTSGTTGELHSTTVVNDGKWHHVAMVYDGTYSASTTTAAHKLYIDGKLEDEEIGSSGAIYSGTISLLFGSRYSKEHFFNGEMDEIRMFAAAKTVTEIRADMFTPEGTNLTHYNALADASTNGLVGRWSCNAGTGSSLVSTGNTDVNATIYDWNGASPAAYTDAWASGGTFTVGTSTLKMTGSSKKLTWTGNENVGSLQISGTTTLQDLAGNDGYLQFNGTFTVDASKTLASTSAERLICDSSSDSIVINNAAGGIANLYSLETFHTSGIISLPACTAPRIICAGNGGTTRLSGNHTSTVRIQANNGAVFNTNGNDTIAKEVFIDGGGEMNLTASSNLTFTDVSGCGFLSSSGTLTSGGTSGDPNTITSSAGGAPTNFWDMETTMTITASYTTFSKYHDFIIDNGSSNTININNCTFTEWRAAGHAFWADNPITWGSFTNNTWTHSGTPSSGLRFDTAYAAFDNINLSGCNFASGAPYDVKGHGVKLEFTNSNFDIDNVANSSGGSVISKDHNDTANLYEITSDGTVTYSAVTNEFGVDADVKLRKGILTMDEDNKSCDTLNVFANGTIRVTDGNDLYVQGAFDNDGTWVQTAGYGGEIHVGDFTPFDSGDIIDDTDFVDTGFHDITHYLEMDL